MTKIYNFCAGPAMIPAPVLKKARAELLDWNGLGTSVMEISHRGGPFKAMAEQSEADLRELMKIPDNYHVLFMHGGGRAQFAAVVNNFMGNKGRALYLRSGQWSKIAAEEAVRLTCESQIDILDIAQKEEATGHIKIEIPEFNSDTREYRYVHYCPNETVDGIEIFETIDSPWPVIADMSSNILSREIDVSKFSLIYAGAQKNIGPSGLSIAIVRDDLLSLPSLAQATIYDYRAQVKEASMYNTPPTFAWYLAAEVFKWLKARGGVEAIEKHNHHKAALLYRAIDETRGFYNDITAANRSLMNVTFKLDDENRNNEFLEKAEQNGLLALKGHRFAGGMRASIYNAMPKEGVEALASYIRSF